MKRKEAQLQGNRNIKKNTNIPWRQLWIAETVDELQASKQNSKEERSSSIEKKNASHSEAERSSSMERKMQAAVKQSAAAR